MLWSRMVIHSSTSQLLTNTHTHIHSHTSIYACLMRAYEQFTLHKKYNIHTAQKTYAHTHAYSLRMQYNHHRKQTHTHTHIHYVCNILTILVCASGAFIFNHCTPRLSVRTCPNVNASSVHPPPPLSLLIPLDHILTPLTHTHYSPHNTHAHIVPGVAVRGNTPVQVTQTRYIVYTHIAFGEIKSDIIYL